jgi:putative cobalt transporter subunit CbtA
LRILLFLAITILSGALAGTILGIINLGLVEPYIDQAIGTEIQNSVSSGENVDLSEIAHYRIWQKSGEIVAAAVYGISLGALFGIIFAYSKNALPGSNYKKKALFLAGILWFVLYLVVAIKYPANPPAVGNPETIYYREALYVAFIAISGFTALILALLWKRVKINSKKIVFPLVYAGIMTAAYLVMPANPDPINISMELVQNFRVWTAVTIGIFWGLLGIIFGSLWDKFIRPEESRLTTFN